KVFRAAMSIGIINTVFITLIQSSERSGIIYGKFKQ
ncbi:unnamed protein product, partial [marine sediment metagenome]